MTLGYQIGIYRKASTDASTGVSPVCLARWDTSTAGRGWIDRLVETGQATVLEQNCGCPDRYTTAAQVVLPMISAEPLPADSPLQEHHHRSGNIYLNRAQISRCSPAATLIIEVWDQS